MRKQHFLLLICFLTCCMISCNEQDAQLLYPSLPNFIEEHNAVQWSESTAKVHLQGTWKWQYEYACMAVPCGGYINKEALNYHLIIEEDKITVEENGVVTQEVSWELLTSNGVHFRIKTEPLLYTVAGSIQFAQDMVLFSTSASDGPDNYFIKIADAKGN